MGGTCTHYVRCGKNAFLIKIRVEIVSDKVDSMNGSWDAYLASLTDFIGADGIITNLVKKREPGIETIKGTP